MNTEVLKLNKGFTLVEKVDTVDTFFAHNVIFSTSKYQRYTEAMLDIFNGSVSLKRHMAVCPNCGRHQPVYHYSNDCKPTLIMNCEYSKEWCFNYSFFDGNYKTIKFFTMPFMSDEITCHNCNHNGIFSNKQKEIILKKNKHIIEISTEVTSIQDVLSMAKNFDIELTEFVLREAIVFNLKKGRVFSKIMNSEKTILVRDITYSNDTFTNEIVRLLNDNEFVKAKLRKMFQEEWKSPLPYRKNELNFRAFALMTVYIGYPKSFYSCIPCICLNEANLEFDKSFKHQSKKLHRYNDVVECFEDSMLPKVKSMKRMMYLNPVFFFYLDEIEKLNSLISDINIFVNFLKSETVIENLNFLHNYENIFLFYKDFMRETDQYTLYRFLTDSGTLFNKYGIIYLSFSKHKKISEQKNWRTKMVRCTDDMDRTLSDYKFNTTYNTNYYGNTSIKEMCIDGFSFVLLRSKRDFLRCGEELNNCLSQLHFSNAVFCMQKNGKALAAIELDFDCGSVVQARLKDNDYIDEDKRIYAAYKKWCKTNNLRDFDDLEYL